MLYRTCTSKSSAVSITYTSAQSEIQTSIFWRNECTDFIFLHITDFFHINKFQACAVVLRIDIYKKKEKKFVASFFYFFSMRNAWRYYCCVDIYLLHIGKKNRELARSSVEISNISRKSIYNNVRKKWNFSIIIKRMERGNGKELIYEKIHVEKITIITTIAAMLGKNYVKKNFCKLSTAINFFVHAFHAFALLRAGWSKSDKSVKSLIRLEFWKHGLSADLNFSSEKIFFLFAISYEEQKGKKS